VYPNQATVLPDLRAWHQARRIVDIAAFEGADLITAFGQKVSASTKVMCHQAHNSTVDTHA
jgi:hypothetical protein